MIFIKREGGEINLLFNAGAISCGDYDMGVSLCSSNSWELSVDNKDLDHGLGQGSVPVFP